MFIGKNRIPLCLTDVEVAVRYKRDITGFRHLVSKAIPNLPGGKRWIDLPSTTQTKLDELIGK